MFCSPFDAFLYGIWLIFIIVCGYLVDRRHVVKYGIQQKEHDHPELPMFRMRALLGRIGK